MKEILNDSNHKFQNVIIIKFKKKNSYKSVGM